MQRVKKRLGKAMGSTAFDQGLGFDWKQATGNIQAKKSISCISFLMWRRKKGSIQTTNWREMEAVADDMKHSFWVFFFKFSIIFCCWIFSAREWGDISTATFNLKRGYTWELLPTICHFSDSEASAFRWGSVRKNSRTSPFRWCRSRISPAISYRRSSYPGKDTQSNLHLSTEMLNRAIKKKN